MVPNTASHFEEIGHMTLYNFFALKRFANTQDDTDDMQCYVEYRVLGPMSRQTLAPNKLRMLDKDLPQDRLQGIIDYANFLQQFSLSKLNSQRMIAKRMHSDNSEHICLMLRAAKRDEYPPTTYDPLHVMLFVDTESCFLTKTLQSLTMSKL